MAEQHDHVKQLVCRLRNDRLIKIVIGKDDSDSNSYLVQQSLLEEASEYFPKALKNEHLGQTTPGTLTFPEDGELQDAWEIVLFWLVHKCLPDGLVRSRESALNQLPLVKAWTLADRYLLPELQDLIMLELLFGFDDKVLNRGIMAEALSISPVDTPLRKIISEEAVYLLYGQLHGESYGVQLKDLLPADGTTGLTASLLAAFEKFRDGKKDFDRRLFSSEDLWKEYMVAGGPSHHWIHEQDQSKAEEERKAKLADPPAEAVGETR